MIKYKCPNCKRETTKQEFKPLVVCGCGYEMVLYSNPKGILKTEMKKEVKKWNI